MASLTAFFHSLPGVFRGLFKHDSSTRAGSVELWVVVPAVLVLIQFAVSSMGPRFAFARQINPGIDLLRVLSYHSVSYTLGLMKPSVSKQAPASTANDFFQIWAVLITTMQDSARIGRPYRPKEMNLVDLLASLWSANQLRSHTALYLKVPLWVIWCIHAFRIIWYYISSNGAAGTNHINMKLVSDYMALSGTHTDDNASPDTMTGYKYLVVGEDRQQNKIEKPRFRLRLEETRPEELITVDKVWTWSRESPNSDGGASAGAGDRLLGRHTDSDNRFKDVCLSFALYKLLRRRFYGVSMPEARDQASRRLVSDGVLDSTNDPSYDRAFRVTEVELSFLQDFSYSKHAVVFAHGFPAHRMLLSTAMMGAALYLVYAVRDIPSISMAQTKDGRVARITHGVLVTHFLIFIVVCRELVEIWVYVMSQWTKVLVVCHYIRLKLKGGEGWLSRLHRRIVEQVARIMFRVILRGRWDQQIQQHNLLMAAGVQTRICCFSRPKSLRSVKLRSEVKTKIFECLKALIVSVSAEGPNDSSESFIRKKNNAALMSYLGDAFADSRGSLPSPIEYFHSKLDGDTHKILAWHVATSICQIHLLEDAGRDQDDLYTLPTPSFGDPPGLAALWPHYTTVVMLSNYSVHLVSMALLPDNGLVARKVFHAVRQEARVALWGCFTWRETRDRIPAEAWAPDQTPDGTNILKIGAQLAAELVSRYGRDELWRRLSRFWTGYLLYVSASTKAAKHQIHLQDRGELTTHLWALLSHAGFLGPNTEHGQQLLDPVDLNAT